MQLLGYVHILLAPICGDMAGEVATLQGGQAQAQRRQDFPQQVGQRGHQPLTQRSVRTLRTVWNIHIIIP